MPVQRIIVGIDESAAGRAALTWAIDEARTERKQLVLVRAYTSTYAMASGRHAGVGAVEAGHPADSPETSAWSGLARAIDIARERLAEEGVEGIARIGSPHDVLLDVAEPADVVVVGGSTHRHWLERRATVHQLLHHTRGPLIVVPAHGSGAAPEQATHAFRGHVVVGVDGSAPSRAALAFGFRYADRHHRPLAAIHVGRRTGDTDVWFDDTFLETHLSREPTAATMLSATVEPFESAFPTVPVKRAVLAGQVRAALVDSARGAVLLAVGRPRPGLVDSISHAVVADGPCATAIVPVAPDQGQTPS